MSVDKSIVAIDGPAGAGKSTVAKLVAKKLGFLYIDTGAMYRALTLKVKRLRLNLKDKTAIIDIMKKTNINLKYNQGSLCVILDGEDITGEIRKPYITDGVSDIAKIKQVRKLMTQLQRKFAKDNDSVLEGRDIGTVVFPKAKYKFFIDADFKERVNRRFKELKENNENVTLEFVEKDLALRDKIDSTREFAPLKKAADAIYIDTTNLRINKVVEKIISCINIKS